MYRISCRSFFFSPPANTVSSYSRRQQQNTSAPFDKNPDDPAKVRSKRQRKKKKPPRPRAPFKNIPPPRRCAFRKLLSSSAIKVIWVLSSGDGGRPGTPSRHRAQSIFFSLEKGWLFPEGAVGGGGAARGRRDSRLMFRS